MLRSSRRYEKQARDELRKMNRTRPTLVQAMQEVAAEGQAQSQAEQAAHQAALAADPTLFGREKMADDLQTIDDMHKRGWLTDVQRAEKRAEREAMPVELWFPPTDTNAPSTTPPGSLVDELARLATLHRDGVLTGDEFSAAKAKLLGA
jgi:hypothetical protein